ncbi:acetoacetyl-CoA synthase [Marssonina coronariae]|uniref:Acetoacetyl-CoA synthase n=1 Tax=Diplocarpon coronariae TaxID=2795749 RepID=A0A218ZEW3_9HELO|nr:acetoacetyl-CoA synthase [Marssonina coronariae]
MRARMVGKQDLVVVVASNSVDTLKIYLAATTLSGLLGSSSADMGVQSGLQRALQVTPKDAPHGGWNEDVVEFRGMVSMPLFSDLVDINKVSRTQILAPYFPKALSRVRDFEPKAFHAPSFIAYSSGRREPQSVSYSPPVVVSSHLPRRKAAQGVDSESVAPQYTATGWIMKLSWLIWPDKSVIDKRVAYRIFLDTLKTPFTPVYVDDTQGPCLGAPVGVCNDLIEGGKGIPGSLPPHGKPGELAAPAAFPNMPVYVWNDPSGSTYFGAYFEMPDNEWARGGFVMTSSPSGLQSGSAKVSPIVKEKFSVLAIVSARAREGRSKGRVAPHAILVNEAQRKIHADVFVHDMNPPEIKREAYTEIGF